MPDLLHGHFGLVWQQVLIIPGKKIPHREIFGPPISPSTTGEISPEGENLPAGVWNVFQGGDSHGDVFPLFWIIQGRFDIYVLKKIQKL
jgi:hypothetical protein